MAPDPVVMYPINHLLAVDFKFVKPGWKSPVNPWFCKWFVNNHYHGSVPAWGIYCPVILCFYRNSLCPNFYERIFPHLGQGFTFNFQDRDIPSAKNGTSIFFFFFNVHFVTLLLMFLFITSSVFIDLNNKRIKFYM